MSTAPIPATSPLLFSLCDWSSTDPAHIGSASGVPPYTLQSAREELETVAVVGELQEALHGPWAVPRLTHTLRQCCTRGDSLEEAAYSSQVDVTSGIGFGCQTIFASIDTHKFLVT